MCKYFFLLAICTSFISCTINITQTDTHGYADDVVDTKNEQEVQAEAHIPVSGI